MRRNEASALLAAVTSVTLIAVGCSQPINPSACTNQPDGWCGPGKWCEKGSGWSRCRSLEDGSTTDVPGGSDVVGSHVTGSGGARGDVGANGESSGGGGGDSAGIDASGDSATGIDVPAGTGCTISNPACCKGCWNGAECRSGTDVSACGAAGSACKPCDDGDPCTADKCSSGVCATDKLSDTTCPTGVCVNGVCRCGRPGEPCCSQSPSCEGGLACKDGRCGTCGSAGAACCPGNQCAAGNSCNTGVLTCEKCGGTDQLCCSGAKCGTGFNCGASGHCNACGGPGQSCCASGSACQSNLTCGSGNTCQCGGIGQACCDGRTCNDDGDRCNGVEVCQGTCQHQGAVTCAATNQCHDAGQCQPATGMCTNPRKTNGATCDDGNSCTQSDSCQDGVCQPGVSKTCASGQRCVGGSCICDAISCSACCVGNQCQLPKCTAGDKRCGPSGGTQDCIANGGCADWGLEKTCLTNQVCRSGVCKSTNLGPCTSNFDCVDETYGCVKQCPGSDIFCFSNDPNGCGTGIPCPSIGTGQCEKF